MFGFGFVILHDDLPAGGADLVARDLKLLFGDQDVECGAEDLHRHAECSAQLLLVDACHQRMSLVKVRDLGAQLLFEQRE